MKLIFSEYVCGKIRVRAVYSYGLTGLALAVGKKVKLKLAIFVGLTARVVEKNLCTGIKTLYDTPILLS